MIELYSPDCESHSESSIGFPVNVRIEGFAPDYRDKIILRWGSSRKIYNSREDKLAGIIGDFPNVINPRKNVMNNLNKLRSLELMSTVVKVPRLFTVEVPAGVKAVLREKSHSHGSNFQLIEGPMEIEEGFYAMEYLEADSEFRVWICGSDTFIGERVALNEEQRAAFPCKSTWGYAYKNSGFPKLREQSLKVSKVLGLEVGAIDVLKYQGEYYFLEKNTSCSVDTNTLRTFFKEGITKLAKQKFPQMFVVAPPIMRPTNSPVSNPISLGSIWNRPQNVVARPPVAATIPNPYFGYHIS